MIFLLAVAVKVTSEDELDVLLLELATTPNQELGPHINLDGISEISDWL